MTEGALTNIDVIIEELIMVSFNWMYFYAYRTHSYSIILSNVINSKNNPNLLKSFMSLRLNH